MLYADDPYAPLAYAKADCAKEEESEHSLADAQTLQLAALLLGIPGHIVSHSLRTCGWDEETQDVWDGEYERYEFVPFVELTDELKELLIIQAEMLTAEEAQRGTKMLDRHFGESEDFRQFVSHRLKWGLGPSLPSVPYSTQYSREML